jgi:hypothetical protein
MAENEGFGLVSTPDHLMAVDQLLNKADLRAAFR